MRNYSSGPIAIKGVMIFCLLVQCSFAYSKELQVQPSGQNAVVGSTLVLPRPSSYFPKSSRGGLRSHVGHPPSSKMIRGARSGERSASYGADRQVGLETASPLRKGETVLPGLPDALVAVVEGAPPDVTKLSVPPKAPVPIQPPGPRVGLVQTASTRPVSLTAAVVDLTDPTRRGLFLPFEPGVGAAALERDDDLLVIFDAARPFDLSAVQDDLLGARSSIQLLPEATILRLPGRRADQVELHRLPNGWLIEPSGSSTPARAVAFHRRGPDVSFPMDAPGRAVIVPDPQTGGNLLVGTTRSDHDAVAATRRGSVATVEKTVLGIVITPLSDRLELRPMADAFLLSGVPPEASIPDEVLSGQDGKRDSRVMSLSDAPSVILYRRLKQAEAAAAAAPAASRFLPRLAAAQDALALGDGQQATTILHVAAADDAREATALRPQLMLAAAALVDHHADGVDLLDDPQLASAGEVGLWRAVKLAERDPSSPEAARRFAANLPLLQSYPLSLRNILLPLAGEALVRGGTEAQAQLESRLRPATALVFAHALLTARQGRKSAALTELDRLAFDRDLRVADKAVEEAISVREAMPAAKPKELADLLEAHLLDARIAGHEAASQLHLAALRSQAGQWEEALKLLREVALQHPEQQTAVRERVADVLKKLASAPSQAGGEGALDQAAIIEANTDMLPDGAVGSQISLYLANRLKALDLPERAAPIIQRMMRATGPGSDKAQLGSQLAALDLQQDDFAGAQSALRESDWGGLSREATETRLILSARASAGAGQLDQAFAVIAPLQSPAALDLRATLLADRGDWIGTTDTLLLRVGHDLPSTGKVDATTQDLLLRLASAASRTADRVRIERARTMGEGRFDDPGKQSLFHLLTSDPVADDVHPVGLSSKMAVLEHVPAGPDTMSK